MTRDVTIHHSNPGCRPHGLATCREHTDSALISSDRQCEITIRQRNPLVWDGAKNVKAPTIYGVTHHGETVLETGDTAEVQAQVKDLHSDANH